MKNKIFIIIIVILTLLTGCVAYFWYNYLREVPVVVDDKTVESIESTDVVVQEESVESDIDKNVEEFEKEIDSIDLDKELADFNDLNW